MSYSHLSTKTLKAKKKYHDECYDWIREYIDQRCYERHKDTAFADLRLLVRVKNDREYAAYIYPGQIYIRQTGVFDGDFSTARFKPELKALADKYKMIEYEY